MTDEQPHKPPGTLDGLERTLIDVVVESWRFSKSYARLVSKLDAGEANRYHSQLRFYLMRLEEALATAGLTVVNIEGHPYDPGAAATALNIADFSPSDRLIIDQMIEPIIMSQSGLKRLGTIMLRRLDP